MNLKKKLTLSILITGLIPFVIVSVIAIRTISEQAKDIQEDYRYISNSAIDKIDRNLFERYGDVQAFGVNKAVNDRESWYQVGAAKNQIAESANKYASLYGFYLLSYMVDTDGRVVAVNDLDPSGKPIETEWLYKKNFKNTDWFRDAMAGRFLKGDGLDGTTVQDVHIDEDVKKVYASDGLVLGFSAPVKNSEGKVIGVWHNSANFTFVEEVVKDCYAHLKSKNQSAAEITLIDSRGRILVDWDPVGNGLSESKRDMNTILKINLVESGNEIAQQLVGGNSGSGVFRHTRKKLDQVGGYSPSVGALGFPGLKWGMMVRLDKDIAFAKMHSQILQLSVLCIFGISGLVIVGWRTASGIAGSLQHGIDSLGSVTRALSLAGETISSSSQEVSAGSSQQAASLEETSASLEEIAAMANRSAQNAVSGRELSQQARVSANNGMARINEMTRTLDAIRLAVKDMETSVSEIQDSNREVGKIIKTIDEIAFQTNLLALNAAVEAARAGEAGMGFAVVADEVRALAQRSANAAKETSEKIECAIKRSEQGGATSVRVVNSLGEVDVTAHNLEEVFRGIVLQITSLDEVISQMTSASSEQSIGVGQVNGALTQLDQVTQNNASNAEANASSADDLSEQVLNLQAVVYDLQVVVSGEQAHGAAPEEDEVEVGAYVPARRRGSAKGRGRVSSRVSERVGTTGLALQKRSVGSESKGVPSSGLKSRKANDDFAAAFKDF